MAVTLGRLAARPSVPVISPARAATSVTHQSQMPHPAFLARVSARVQTGHRVTSPSSRLLQKSRRQTQFLLQCRHRPADGGLRQPEPPTGCGEAALGRRLPRTTSVATRSSSSSGHAQTKYGPYQFKLWTIRFRQNVGGDLYPTQWKEEHHGTTTGVDHRRLERHRAGRRRPLAAAGDIPIGLARTSPRTSLASSTRSISPIGPPPPTVGKDRRAPERSMRWSTTSASAVRPDRVDRAGRLFDTYDMNVRTAVQVVQAALPGMLAAGWGRIVNVTSLTTLGTPERTPYAAAKAALEACTRIWANELASTGITVNAVAPDPPKPSVPRAQPDRVRTRNPLPGNHSAASGRYTAGDPSRDLRAAGRGRRLHHRPDPAGRRRGSIAA